MEVHTEIKERDIEAYRQKLKIVSGLVLADEIPQEGVDVLIFITRAVGDVAFPDRPGNDETGLFEHVGKLLDNGKVRNVLLFGSDGQQWDADRSITKRYNEGVDKMKANAGRSEYLRNYL